MNIQLVYANPRDIFYPAVVLRTAYIATGMENIQTILLSKKFFKISDLARFSRLPAEYIDKILILPAEDVVLQEVKTFNPNFIVLVSDKIKEYEEIKEINVECLKKSEKVTVIVDDVGEFAEKVFNDLELHDRCYKFWTGVFKRPCYETIALMYELVIRDIPERCVKYFEQDLSKVDISELFYILSHVKDSIFTLNNFVLVNPRTVVFALRHVYLNHGYYVDMVCTDVKLDHVRGHAEEIIKISIYDSKRLLKLWDDEVKLEGRVLEIPLIAKDGSVVRVRMFLDVDKSRIIVSKDLVYTGRETPIEEIGQLFQLL